jgi:Fe-S-cluster formation regulator IscX/YfhJ
MAFAELPRKQFKSDTAIQYKFLVQFSLVYLPNYTDDKHKSDKRIIKHISILWSIDE